jgi:DNA-binding transcriptional MerR regulator
LKRYYSAKEVMVLADVTYRRLDSWVRRGIIRSSAREAGASRRRRLFTFSDVVEVRTLRLLTASGVRLSALQACVERLRRDLGRQGDNVLASSRLVTDGVHIFRYVSNEDRLEQLDQYGQFAFAFGIGDEITSLSQKAQALDRRSRYERPLAQEVPSPKSYRERR